jgi:hypothetical protein
VRPSLGSDKSSIHYRTVRIQDFSGFSADYGPYGSYSSLGSASWLTSGLPTNRELSDEKSIYQDRYFGIPLIPKV